MSRLFAVDAVLFDLDGTLLDTIDDLVDAANRMLAELGRPLRTRAEIHRFVGKGIENLVARCLGETADAAACEAAVAVFRRHYHAVNGVHAKAFDGVVELLAALAARGVPMACVTNKATDFTLPLLAKCGVADYFAAVVCGDTLPHKKPHPAMLELACRQLGVEPSRALMVGDSANDALSARAAGCPVLLMTYGYSEGAPVDTIDCDGLLSSAADLLARIAPQPA
ncbi:MAG: phosphoglycolate phosphatase [Rhodocyclaceae bacterium]|nr:phosphoglycolate phosphatase [Rhodocyclaceae bacterium]